METLRNELYNQIEALELELRNEDNNNQFGFSSSEIHFKIQELETKISETWAS